MVRSLEWQGISLANLQESSSANRSGVRRKTRSASRSAGPCHIKHTKVIGIFFPIFFRWRSVASFSYMGGTNFWGTEREKDVRMR